MKIYIDEDEMYPVYFYHKKKSWSGSTKANITKKQLEFIESATENYNKAQDILEKLYER